jgi:hypothetical protein
MSATILCVDKRTGQVYGPESIPGQQYLRITGDPAQKTVDFAMPQPRTLKFSDRPLTPPSKTAEALWKAFWRIGGSEPPVRLPGTQIPPASGEKKPAAVEGKR